MLPTVIAVAAYRPIWRFSSTLGRLGTAVAVAMEMVLL